MSDVRLFTLDGAQSRHPEVDRWLAEQAPPLGDLARRWFEAMRQAGPDVVDLLHDGHPTACIGTLAFGYVGVFSAHVNVGFFLGNQLQDPAGLLLGGGRYMRHVKLVPGAHVDEAALQQLVHDAYRDMRARLVPSHQR